MTLATYGLRKMVMPPETFDSLTESSPLRSISKLSVRNVAAGFESFSRNHAEHTFSVCRISRTLSRAQNFLPLFALGRQVSWNKIPGRSAPGSPQAWRIARVHREGTHRRCIAGGA